MPLPTGTQIGPYEIITLVGAGGMGEVYRARDTRLEREVAVKILPSSIASDEDRLRRFEQETRAAGMINHPNVMAIYDVGEHEGSPYVVSELLEGETLRALLDRGPLPPRKATEYARQIVNGLAAAHEKGIVHRDLKPENIFVTRDGWIKVLDFGLAKLLQNGFGDNEANDLATMTTTQPGTVLGTVGYMAPEQVRAQSTDHRADIFSFGVIFYEMLTGRRAFKRDSAVETMSAILSEEPPEMSEANRVIPPAIERIVRHCLEKNPDERFQSARDLNFHLEAVTGISTPTEELPLLARKRLQKRLWPWAAAVSLLALLLIAFLVGSWLAPIAGRGTASASGSASFQQLTYRRGSIFGARFSGDGKTIYYGASWDGKPVELFSTAHDNPEPRAVLANADILSISSKDEMAILMGRRYLGPFLWTGTLARVPAAGGSPREIAENVHAADWHPNAEQLALVRAVDGKHRLEYPAGKTLYETSGAIFTVRFSPDGDSIAFLERPLGFAGEWTLSTVDLSGRKRELMGGWQSAWGVAWSPDGDEVWFVAGRGEMPGSLYGITPSGRRRLILRVPGTLTLYDISREGRALLGHSEFRAAITVLPPGEDRERDISWFGASVVTGLSSDGQTLLFMEGARGPSIYLRRTDGSPATRLGDGVPLALTPDGRFALAVPNSPIPQLALLPTGPGEARNIVNESLVDYAAGAFFDEGRKLIFAAREQGRPSRLFVQEINGKLQPVTPENAGTAGRPGTFAVSPDGQWVAALAADQKVRLFPLAGGQSRDIPKLEAGVLPIGWADARTLYVYRPAELPARIQRVDIATGRAQPWKELMPADPAGVLEIARVVFSPGGRSYAYSDWRLLSDLFVVDGLK